MSRMLMGENANVDFAVHCENSCRVRSNTDCRLFSSAKVRYTQRAAGFVRMLENGNPNQKRLPGAGESNSARTGIAERVKTHPVIALSVFAGTSLLAIFNFIGDLQAAWTRLFPTVNMAEIVKALGDGNEQVRLNAVTRLSKSNDIHRDDVQAALNALEAHLHKSASKQKRVGSVNEIQTTVGGLSDLLKRADEGGMAVSRPTLNELNLSSLELANLHLKNIRIFSVDFENSNLMRTDLSESRLQDVSVMSADGSGLMLNGARIDNSCFAQANMSDAQLRAATLNHSDFSGAILKNAKLQGAKIVETNWDRVDIRGADMSSTDFGLAEGILQGQLPAPGVVSGMVPPKVYRRPTSAACKRMR